MESKNYYKPLKDFTQTNYDAIVIGSGIGGMSCASALSHYGKKVLVLEQHYVPGGYTHSFSRKGFTWDAGVHAIGEMKGHELPARVFSWLSDDSIKWQSLGNPYDRFFYPDGFQIDFPDSKRKFLHLLKEKFPNETSAIDQFEQLIYKVLLSCKSYFVFKTLPEWIDAMGSSFYHMFKKDWWGITLQQVLDSITTNKQLQAVLSAQWGYHGSTPQKASFAIHALMMHSFWNGAYYPVGGSHVIAEGLLTKVKNAGGETLVRADVDHILIKNNKAIGVKLKTGEEFFAPNIISAAGAKTTVNTLIPTEHLDSSWIQSINSIPSSSPYICMNIGFEGDIKAVGANTCNFWFNETYDMNIPYWDISKENTEAPILYVSFPSLKDPLYNPGVENKHTGECITFVDWSSFQKWEHTRRGKREKSYQDFKKILHEKTLAQLSKHMPDTMKLATYHEFSTPLSAQFFTKAHQGAIYGLEATPYRFQCKKLRTRTPIKNLFMTGIDVATVGVVGGMIGGLLTAATIDKRIYKKLL